MFFSFLMSVCIWVHMFMNVRVHMFTFIERQEVNLRYNSRGSDHLAYRVRVSYWPRTHQVRVRWLTNSHEGSTHLPLPSQYWH